MSVDGDEDENFRKIKIVLFILLGKLWWVSFLNCANVATQAAGAHFIILLVIIFLQEKASPGKCSVWVQESRMEVLFEMIRCCVRSAFFYKLFKSY